MKRQIFVVALFASIILSAQSQKEIRKGFFNHLKTDALILSEDGLVRSAREIKDFLSDFVKSNGEVNSYKKDFSIQVSSILEYEIGEIQTNANSFSVMFLRKKDDESGPRIEFLVIYQKSNSASQPSDIDRSRTEWMELCNAHRADELVKRMYTTDAYYYNRGRLLQGTKSITEEYSYMNSPAYSLELTPRHVAFVTSDIAYEIGQCSGSYNKPYMLLWEKRVDGNWQVLMDSND